MRNRKWAESPFLLKMGRKSMEELTRIRIGKKAYPVKLDINVLETIQEEYGSIVQFERDILGIEPVYDSAGKLIDAVNKEPSIKAIKIVLPAMINEGLKIEADWQNKEFDRVEAEMVFRECDMDFNALADLIHKEFKKCFATKK